MKPGYIRLSSPWLLSGVPALAYLVAYLDRLGEAYAHRVPTDWISISLTDALSRTAAIALVLGLLVTLARAGGGWTKRLPRWARRGANKFIDQLAPTAVLVLILGSLRVLAVFLAATVLFTCGTLIRDFRRRDSLTSDAEPERLSPVLLEPPQPSDLGEVQIRASLAIAVVGTSLVLALVGGWGRAVMQDTALVTEDGSRIVAANYGGTAVLADLVAKPDGRWRVGPRRQLVRLDSESAPVFTLRSTSSISW